MWQRHAYKLHSLNHKVHGAIGFSSLNGLMHPYVIGVSGIPKGNKSNFCRRLVECLGKEQVLHICYDHYSNNQPHTPFLEKDILDTNIQKNAHHSLLISHLDELALGKNVCVPHYDFSKHNRIIENQISSPKSIVLIEGFLLYESSDLVKRMNHKILIDSPQQTPNFSPYFEYAKLNSDQVISENDSFDIIIAELCMKVLKEIMVM